VLKASNHVKEALGFFTVLHRVSEYAVSEPGAAEIMNLMPFTNRDALALELDNVDEMKELLSFDDPFPLNHFISIEKIIEKAEIPGAYVDSRSLLAVVTAVKVSAATASFIEERKEKYPGLYGIVQHCTGLDTVIKAISHAIGPDGEVLDRASARLARIRKDIDKTEARARALLDRVMQDMAAKGYTQESSLAVRGGKLVVPMKESFRGRIQGVMVDASASGQTVFIEPLEAVEMGNRVRSLRAEEADEIEKILISLTSRVRDESGPILSNYHSTVVIDSLFARAGFAAEYECAPCSISESLVDLKQAYHPLLLFRKERREVVPLYIHFGESVKTVVLTGPNAGGKTVALKTIGLLALLHMHGMHIPAMQGSAMPLFTRVFIDIGDDQSIEQDLSSFSSHIAAVKEIVNHADSASLILLDEIGSATDPAEGAAIAEVLLRRFTDKGCLTLATTHMGGLKVFAQKEPGVENGSMAFDTNTLMPTYQFRMGVPGSSYAFEISQRLGLDPGLIQEAREIVGEDRGRLDNLIRTMEEKYQKAEELLADADIKDTKLSGLIKLYERKLEELRRDGDLEREKIIDEARTLLEDANATVEHVIKDLREEKASKQAIKKAKQDISYIKKRVRQAAPQKNPAVSVIAEGDWVRWKGHKGRGEVVSSKDSTGRVLVQWGDLRLRITETELELLEKHPDNDKQQVTVSYSAETLVSDELDLRGMTAFEARQAVEKFIDSAAVSSLNYLRVIHGKGTGVLRAAVHEVLKKNRLVKQWRLGNLGEGDTGVTIVELQ